MAKLYDVPLRLLKAPITTRTQDQVKAISLPRFLSTVVIVGCFILTFTLLHLKSSSHIIFLEHKNVTCVHKSNYAHLFVCCFAAVSWLFICNVR